MWYPRAHMGTAAARVLFGPLVEASYDPFEDDMGESSVQRFISEGLRPEVERLLRERGKPTFVGADQYVGWHPDDRKKVTAAEAERARADAAGAQAIAAEAERVKAVAGLAKADERAEAERERAEAERAARERAEAELAQLRAQIPGAAPAKRRR